MRYNPLRGEWVLVCPHRMKRPWAGQIEPSTDEEQPEYDPQNPLCPGNTRAGGKVYLYLYQYLKYNAILGNTRYFKLFHWVKGTIESNFSISKVTAKYEKTYSFVNDFPALLENIPRIEKSEDDLFKIEPVGGTCKVLCFHPKSNVTLALMKVEEIVEVITQ